MPNSRNKKLKVNILNFTFVDHTFIVTVWGQHLIALWHLCIFLTLEVCWLLPGCRSLTGLRSEHLSETWGFPRSSVDHFSWPSLHSTTLSRILKKYFQCITLPITYDVGLAYVRLSGAWRMCCCPVLRCWVVLILRHSWGRPGRVAGCAGWALYSPLLALLYRKSSLWQLELSTTRPH